mmetsp:Transcript_9619/g.35661  ORF Transcript_9619/g.35661 Transcript_9619/m.35661 type:complete len:83 (-) Transcript_9619:193-441(-)
MEQNRSRMEFHATSHLKHDVSVLIFSLIQEYGCIHEDGPRINKVFLEVLSTSPTTAIPKQMCFVAPNWSKIGEPSHKSLSTK